LTFSTVELYKETISYSVLTKNWILPFKNNDNSLFAKWPPFLNVTSDRIFAAMDPLSERQSFKIILLGDGRRIVSCLKIIYLNSLFEG